MAKSLILFLLLLGLAGAAAASCCNGISRLNWESRHDILEYHSCGCADACWVAELRQKKTRRLKARLRCDCEKSYVSIGPGPIGGPLERPYENTCIMFEGDNKFQAIHDAMKEIATRQVNGAR